MQRCLNFKLPTSSKKDVFSVNTGGNSLDHVAALVWSHKNGSIPFNSTTE